MVYLLLTNSFPFNISLHAEGTKDLRKKLMTQNLTLPSNISTDMFYLLISLLNKDQNKRFSWEELSEFVNQELPRKITITKILELPVEEIKLVA
jgi:hypothetical protein